jgi:hypothetical protein
MPFKCSLFFLCSLGASYKTFVILNSGNLDSSSFLSIIRKFLHAKEKNKAHSCVFVMIIIIAAVYGNEFVTSFKTT